MAVPTSISDLSTTAASNSPAGSDSISAATGPDDYLRAHAAIIKTLAGSVTTDIAAAVSTHAGLADPHPLYALEAALGTASAKDTGTTAGTVPLVGTKSATELLAGLVELATQAEAEAGTDDTVVMTALKTSQAIAAQAALITLGTKQDSTSGVAIDFIGIPATATRIVVMFENVSTNGTGQTVIQLGDSGGLETTGYASSAFRINSGGTVVATVSTGFLTGNEVSATDVRNGMYVLEKLTGDTWVGSGVFSSAGGQTCCAAGAKTLSGTLTQLRITTTSGDTFDLGQINISVE